MGPTKQYLTHKQKPRDEVTCPSLQNEYVKWWALSPQLCCCKTIFFLSNYAAPHKKCKHFWIIGFMIQLTYRTFQSQSDHKQRDRCWSLRRPVPGAGLPVPRTRPSGSRSGGDTHQRTRRKDRKQNCTPVSCWDVPQLFLPRSGRPPGMFLHSSLFKKKRREKYRYYNYFEYYSHRI